MSEVVVFEAAQRADESAVSELLVAANLPTDDIELHLDNFVLARLHQELIGCIGFERHGDLGLLRSLAVRSEFRGQGIAHELCARVEILAKSAGIQELYLLTTTAAEFFEKTGYEGIDRNKAPAVIQENKHFTTLCPSSAVLMTKRL